MILLSLLFLKFASGEDIGVVHDFELPWEYVEGGS